MFTIEDFLSKIAKPMFVFRMARGNAGHISVRSRKSAETRMSNATIDIENLVLEYAEAIKQRRETEGQ